MLSWRFHVGVLFLQIKGWKSAELTWCAGPCTLSNSRKNNLHHLFFSESVFALRLIRFSQNKIPGRHLPPKKNSGKLDSKVFCIHVPEQQVVNPPILLVPYFQTKRFALSCKIIKTNHFRSFCIARLLVALPPKVLMDRNPVV